MNVKPRHPRKIRSSNGQDNRMLNLTQNPKEFAIHPDEGRAKRAGIRSALARTCLKEVTLEKPPWD